MFFEDPPTKGLFTKISNPHFKLVKRDSKIFLGSEKSSIKGIKSVKDESLYDFLSEGSIMGFRVSENLKNGVDPA